MAATQDGILMLWLLPLAAVGGGAYLSLLTDHDIDWYLSERPPAFWIAIGTGTVRPVSTRTYGRSTTRRPWLA